ncbi:MAG: N-acetylmuramoyl-L-alanine amidase [Rhodospirillales bacterium]|nr:N-acetylmuramoyl-L-alanine amidase [Rhodospirillales bacterium]
MIRILVVILCLVAAAPASYAKPNVSAARIGQHPDMVRFVLEISEAPAYQVFTLPDPFRVVIDLPELDWRLPAESVPRNAGLVQDLRFGLFAPGRSRVVLDVKQPVQVTRVVVLPPDGNVSNHRVVVDIRAVSRQAFFESERIPLVSTVPLPAPQTAGLPKPQAKPGGDERRTIVIDAGHGGIDPGAKGVSGVYEKALVLDYARELQRQLLATGRYRVVLTRDSDVFLPLRNRFELAQRAEGDLFISLHANTHPKGSVRGASVYTISEKSSDKEAEALAAKENKADVLAGVNLDAQTDDVNRILIDLIWRETMNLSKNFANLMVTELGKSTRLLNNTHRFAGFAVLKSPTVPSVLVEVGYMSNRAEEAQLRSKGHREKVSGAIRRAIDKYLNWQEQMSRS